MGRAQSVGPALGNAAEGGSESAASVPCDWARQRRLRRNPRADRGLIEGLKCVYQLPLYPGDLGMPEGGLRAVLFVVAHHDPAGRWVGEFFTDSRAAEDRFKSSSVAESLWEIPVVVDPDQGRILRRK